MTTRNALKAVWERSDRIEEGGAGLQAFTASGKLSGYDGVEQAFRPAVEILKNPGFSP